MKSTKCRVKNGAKKSTTATCIIIVNYKSRTTCPYGQIQARHESPTEGRAIRQNFISEIKMRWDTKSRQNHGIHRTNYFIKAHSIFITRQRHYRTNNISLEDALGKKCIRKCIKKQYCGCS